MKTFHSKENNVLPSPYSHHWPWTFFPDFWSVLSFICCATSKAEDNPVLIQPKCTWARVPPARPTPQGHQIVQEISPVLPSVLHRRLHHRLHHHPHLLLLLLCLLKLFHFVPIHTMDLGKSRMTVSYQPFCCGRSKPAE